MMKQLVRIAVGVGMGAAVLTTSGCATVSTRLAPKADLAGLKHLYVVHLLTDGRGVDAAIVRELRHRGYNATYGPRTEMPENADAAIVYQDTWASDFTTYMIGLDLQIRTPRTDYPIAVAYAHRPSVFSQPPRVLIDKLVNKLFPAKTPLPDLPPYPPQPDFGNTIAPSS